MLEDPSALPRPASARRRGSRKKTTSPVTVFLTALSGMLLVGTLVLTFLVIEGNQKEEDLLTVGQQAQTRAQQAEEDLKALRWRHDDALRDNARLKELLKEREAAAKGAVERVAHLGALGILDTLAERSRDLARISFSIAGSELPEEVSRQMDDTVDALALSLAKLHRHMQRAQLEGGMEKALIGPGVEVPRKELGEAPGGAMLPVSEAGWVALESPSSAAHAYVVVDLPRAAAALSFGRMKSRPSQILERDLEEFETEWRARDWEPMASQDAAASAVLPRASPPMRAPSPPPAAALRPAAVVSHHTHSQPTKHEFAGGSMAMGEDWLGDMGRARLLAQKRYHGDVPECPHGGMSSDEWFRTWGVDPEDEERQALRMGGAGGATITARMKEWMTNQGGGAGVGMNSTVEACLHRESKRAKEVLAAAPGCKGAAATLPRDAADPQEAGGQGNAGFVSGQAERDLREEVASRQRAVYKCAFHGRGPQHRLALPGERGAQMGAQVAAWAGYGAAYSVSWSGPSDGGLTFAAGLLKRMGIRGSFYIHPQGVKGAEGGLSTEDKVGRLRGLVLDGHEVGVHARSGDDLAEAARAAGVMLGTMGANYTLSAAFQRQHLATAAEALRHGHVAGHAPAEGPCKPISSDHMTHDRMETLPACAIDTSMHHNSERMDDLVRLAIKHKGWVVEHADDVSSCADWGAWTGGRVGHSEQQHRFTGEYRSCHHQPGALDAAAVQRHYTYLARLRRAVWIAPVGVVARYLLVREALEVSDPVGVWGGSVGPGGAGRAGAHDLDAHLKRASVVVHVRLKEGALLPPEPPAAAVEVGPIPGAWLVDWARVNGARAPVRLTAEGEWWDGHVFVGPGAAGAAGTGGHLGVGQGGGVAGPARGRSVMALVDVIPPGRGDTVQVVLRLKRNPHYIPV